MRDESVLVGLGRSDWGSDVRQTNSRHASSIQKVHVSDFHRLSLSFEEAAGLRSKNLCSPREE